MLTRISAAAALIVVAATVAGIATGGQALARQRKVGGTAATRAGTAHYTGTIAFVRDGDDDALYVIHADGSGLQRITPPGTGVSEYKWSPNGRLIAYIDESDGSLWLVRPDGTGLRRLLRGSKHASVALSWSPDGRRIAVISPGPSASLQTAQCEGLPIFLVPIHGSHPTVLRGAKAGCGIAWSSRNQIASDGGDISVIRPDGSGGRQLLWVGGGPQWSSDGKQLVFNVAIRLRNGNTTRYRAFAVTDANGRHYHVVTRQAYTEYGEVWSPHGRRILYGGANGGIYVIGSDRGNNRRVTTDSPGQSLAPKLAWSPDGRSIVYAASTGGLYEVGVNGRDKVQLTGPANGDEDPSWVGGGRGAREQG